MPDRIKSRPIAGPYRSPTLAAARWFHHFWQERLTEPGRWVLGVSMAWGLAGGFPEVMIGMAGFTITTAIIFMVIATAIVRRPKLHVQRSLPMRCVAGSTIDMVLTLTNVARHPVLDVSAYEYRLNPKLKLTSPPDYVVALVPKESKSLTYRLAAAERGCYRLAGPSSLSCFPFGLTQSCRFHRQEHRLLVYPAFQRLKRLDVPTGQKHQPGGIVLTSQVGESMEFIGNREYRPGDRLRDLHPRSWARVGYPVVKQFQQEFLTRIAILVDTFPPPDSPPHSPLAPGNPPTSRASASAFLTRILDPKHQAKAYAKSLLEANLSLAASVADYLARQEYVIDLFAAGPELYHFQAGRSLAYFENILDILACIDPCPTDPIQRLSPMFSRELNQVSSVIVLLLNADDHRRDMVQRILDAGVQCKTILLSDRHAPADLVGLGRHARLVTLDQVQRGLESL